MEVDHLVMMEHLEERVKLVLVVLKEKLALLE